MQKCDITGKGKQFGNNVSDSLRRTKKVWKPNLQTKILFQIDRSGIDFFDATQSRYFGLVNPSGDQIL